MQFSTQRAFETESDFDLGTNEEYLLCVDSWINNGADVIRSNRGCGLFSIDLPVTVEEPDNEGEGENGEGGEDGEGNQDELDGQDGEEGIEKDSAQTLALATAVLALGLHLL